MMGHNNAQNVQVNVYLIFQLEDLDEPDTLRNHIPDVCLEASRVRRMISGL